MPWRKLFNIILVLGLAAVAVAVGVQVKVERIGPEVEAVAETQSVTEEEYRMAINSSMTKALEEFCADRGWTLNRLEMDMGLNFLIWLDMDNDGVCDVALILQNSPQGYTPLGPITCEEASDYFEQYQKAMEEFESQSPEDQAVTPN